jgi:hypothetical protein
MRPFLPDRLLPVVIHSIQVSTSFGLSTIRLIFSLALLILLLLL